MEENQKYDLTEGPIAKKLLMFFLPIAVGTLFQQLYNTVDAIVVGKFVGTEALAAVGGSASQIVSLFIGFFVALTSGAGAIIAQLFGAKRQDMISTAVATSISFCFWIGIALTIVGIPLTPYILFWMDTPPDTMADSILYLRIYFSGTIFVLLFNMGSSVLRSVGDSKRPLIYLIVSCVGNIILDILFVVGFHMGVDGVALATVISQAVSTVMILVHLCRTKEIYRVEFRQIHIHKPTMMRMLRIGVPAGIQATLYNFANLIVQVAVNSLGTVVVAAWTMSGKIDGIYWAISGALGTAVMSFVGQNFGAGKMDRIHKSFKISMGVFLGLTVLISGGLLLVGRYCLGYFIDDPAVIARTWEILTFFVPFYVVWTFIEIISGLLRGVGDAVIPVIIVAVGICGIRLLWVKFVFAYFPTLMGVSLCYPVSWFVTAVALTIYYIKGNWRKLTPPDVAK